MTHRLVLRAFIPALLFLAGCGRAPAFDILGSFFPAWMVCLVPAIILTVLSLALLRRYVEIAWPVLVYPGLTALFAFAIWLVLFR
ncbi:MAG TPA: YtcA family lipoprotein [Candidatus Sulfotelmatobacter sp.]|nr:YtcA family lipoprotein [Candidatus Sulfotelmatobacter sp.]